MFDVVGDVPENGYAHNEQVELYVLDLPTQLLSRRPVEYATNLLPLLLLLTQFGPSRLLLTLLLTQFHILGDLFGDLLVAVVNDLNQKLATLIDGRPVEH